MIANLSGTLSSKSPTEIVVDVNGVGYAVTIPLSTFERLGALNSPVHLFTHLHVREDELHLYGFATEPERNMFRLLISVSGIGPRTAQGILSGSAVHDIARGIAAGDIAGLTKIPNIGRKTAERIVMELRDKVGDVGRDHPGSASDSRSQAMLALTSLGYARASAEKAVAAVLGDAANANLSLEELVKRSLARIAQRG